MHLHAFSPLEIWQGASTLGIPIESFLSELKEAGLGSLPGTAAEILDDEVRAIICPDKITTAQWLEVVETAHTLGVKTTATIMFGHVDHYRHWARHLLHIRDLQSRTGGFTEFVPLPFVPTETPLHLKGLSRLGPTYREAVLMHAVARLALHPVVKNIQTSWVKMGRDGVATCLQSGRQRSRRHVDEREHHAGRGRASRRGNAAGNHGTDYFRARQAAAATYDPVWRRAAGASCRLICARPLQRTTTNVAPKSADCT